ncbi:MAG: hypothetical protein AVDCRST_MAG54-4743, partial [uncultured Actinomycetospora sp.]
DGSDEDVRGSAGGGGRGRGAAGGRVDGRGAGRRGRHDHHAGGPGGVVGRVPAAHRAARDRAGGVVRGSRSAGRGRGAAGHGRRPHRPGAEGVRRRVDPRRPRH